MTDLFILQLLLTFFAGVIWIFLTVLAGSYFGSKISGFIGGLPSTALLSFFFIGYTQSPETASKATDVFPLAIGISGMFLVVFAWFSKLGFIPALLAGLTAWFIMSTLLVFLRPESFFINIVIYVSIMYCSYYILENILMIKSTSNEKTGLSLKHLLYRSMFGGTIIMLSVLIAKLGGPFLGGILAAFPAMFMATLTITYQVHGIDFSRGMTKSLLVTGMLTVAVYAITIRYLYPSAGLYWGTLAAIIISAMSAYFTLIYVLRRIS
jgi:hypothetical protein